MKKNRAELVHVPRTEETAIVPSTAPQAPVAVYLASLAPSSRPSMISGLHVIADMWRNGADAYSVPWADLRFIHTAAIRAKLVERYQPRTVNRMISSLRGVLKAAWNIGQMSTDDYHRAIQIKLASTSNLKPSGRWMEQPEIKRLMVTAADQKGERALRDAALVVVLYAGGLRRDEASALQLDDYTRRDRKLEVRKGKRGKYRAVYIPEGYAGWIEPWIDLRSEGPMFVRWRHYGRTDEPLSPQGVWRILRELRDRAELPKFTPHDLRRSYATELLDNGADLLQVQALMGHSSLNTTKIYDRRGERGKQAAVTKLPVAMTYDEFKKRRP